MGQKDRGLYGKFKVKRTDGKSDPGEKHENCQYFVIDIDHDEFAAPALLEYARKCQDDYPVLSGDLVKIFPDGLSNPFDFITEFNSMAGDVNRNAVDHGFWEGSNHNNGEKICLVHSELSEMLEGLRKGNPESVKIPGYSNAEE